MKYILIYILFLIPLASSSQSSFVDRNPSAFEYRDYVENLKDTTLVVLINHKFTSNTYDGWSKLIGVFYNKNLVKISSWFGLSYGINSCDYYIKNGELLFIEEKFKGYKYNNDKFDYSEFEIYANGWYLFKSGNLIDSESLGHWRFEDDSINPKDKLNSEFKEYSILLNMN